MMSLWQQQPAAAIPLEGHGESLEVLGEGAQRAEEVDAQDEVETA